MKQSSINSWIGTGLRLGLGGILLYAGALKIREPQRFADAIAAYQLLHPVLISLTALSLPVMEILTGLMLITARHVRAAILSTLLLTITFALALLSAAARGLNVDCGCFGDGASTPSDLWLAIARDLLMMAAAAYLWHSPHPGTPRRLNINKLQLTEGSPNRQASKVFFCK